MQLPRPRAAHRGHLLCLCLLLLRLPVPPLSAFVPITSASSAIADLHLPLSAISFLSSSILSACPATALALAASQSEPWIVPPANQPILCALQSHSCSLLAAPNPPSATLLQAGSELSFYCGCIRLLRSFYKVKTVLSVSCGSEDGLAGLPQVGTYVSLLHRREVVISSAPPPPVPTAAPRALLSAPSFPPHRAASQATSVAPPWACFGQHAHALWTFPGTPGCSHRAAFLPACCQASHSLTRSTLASPPGRM